MSRLLADVLDRSGLELDISVEQQEAAVSRYHHLADFLTTEQTGRADVSIYPQGSFRLGTVVRPTELDADFDIDLVFQRSLLKTSTTQEQLREEAGGLLRRYCEENDLSQPVGLGRCWRLDFFDDHFHLDVLPVIPNPDVSFGILLSDRELTEWLPSNPIGYANWFYDRMNRRLFEKARAVLAHALQRDVAQVPDFLVRTPLQRVVQILKRSRDEYFRDERDVQPTSILITTLAAWAYNGQPDVGTAMTGIVGQLPQQLELRDGLWWLPNPADPAENFADKWNTYPERHDAFERWFAQLSAEVLQASRHTAIEQVVGALRASVGPVVELAQNSLRHNAAGTPSNAATGLVAAPGEEFIEDAVPVNITDTVSVSFDVADTTERRAYRPRGAIPQRRLAKHRGLRFKMTATSVRPPYQVLWKVRNFGRAAWVARGLRGQIKPDAGNEELLEATLYPGDHYAECYVVKDGVCVARRRIWVPIS